jgi:hypothetical protein
MNKKYTIVSRRSDFCMWRKPIWETTLFDKITKENPFGIYSGLLITKDLWSTNSYAEAKAAKKFVDEVGFTCQWKIVHSSKINEIVETTKKSCPHWKKFLVDDESLVSGD